MVTERYLVERIRSHTLLACEPRFSIGDLQEGSSECVRLGNDWRLIAGQQESDGILPSS